MGTFHVISRDSSGDLRAFRRELGKLRETGHCRYERHARMLRIAARIGYGHAVRQCLVDTGHPSGREVHVLTSTAIVLVFSERTGMLVTALVARPGQVERYYRPFGEEVPPELMEQAYDHTVTHHWNY